MSSAQPSAAQLQSALHATSGRVTGISPGNWCIISFPASWGQDTWNGFVRGMFDFACVWTGNSNSPMEEWFDPWKDNVLEAQRKGMKLLVMGHEDCHQPGGAQITHNNKKFRLGNGQTIEVKWLNEQGIDYKVYSMWEQGGQSYSFFRGPKAMLEVSPLLRSPALAP